jgi:hypothetical protein
LKTLIFDTMRHAGGRSSGGDWLHHGFQKLSSRIGDALKAGTRLAVGRSQRVLAWIPRRSPDPDRSAFRYYFSHLTASPLNTHVFSVSE